MDDNIDGCTGRPPGANSRQKDSGSADGLVLGEVTSESTSERSCGRIELDPFRPRAQLHFPSTAASTCPFFLTLFIPTPPTSQPSILK